MKLFDSLIIGEIAQDTNVDYDGTTVKAIGGAVYYSAFAASAMGHQIAVLPKADTSQIDLHQAFADASNVKVFPLHSKTSFVTKNVYHTPDRERRTSTVDSVIEPYSPFEVPEINARIWHLAGLVAGDIPNEMISYAAQRAMVALDVQTMLRHAENGTMILKDWPEKKEYLPLIHYLKTDAAEAETLTGEQDRAKAIRILASWGAKEVMLTHHTEVMVCVDGEIYAAPFTARNLSGRTGRGDTCFASYCYWRLNHTPEEACRFAAAVTSRKMERPGPFKGNINDISAQGSC